MKKFYWVAVMIWGLIGFAPRLSGLLAAAWENAGSLNLNHALSVPSPQTNPAPIDAAFGYLARAGTEVAAYQLGLLAVWYEMPLAEPLPADAAALVARMLTQQTGELIRSGQDEVVAAWYSRSQRLGLALPDYWLQTGRHYAARQAWDAAATAFEQATTLTPHPQAAWYELGIVYVKSGRYEEAIPALEQALALRPPTVPLSPIYYYLGLAYQRQQTAPDLAAARRAFQTALDLNEYGPTTFRTETLFEMGYSYTLEQSWATAIPYLEQVLTANPGHYAAQVHLGRAYWQTGDGTTGLQYGLAAITLKPDVAAAYLLVSDIYREQGDMPQAQSYFAQAYTLTPDNPQVQARLPYFPDWQP